MRGSYLNNTRLFLQRTDSFVCQVRIQTLPAQTVIITTVGASGLPAACQLSYCCSPEIQGNREYWMSLVWVKYSLHKYDLCITAETTSNWTISNIWSNKTFVLQAQKRKTGSKLHFWKRNRDEECWFGATKSENLVVLNQTPSNKAFVFLQFLWLVLFRMISSPCAWFSYFSLFSFYISLFPYLWNVSRSNRECTAIKMCDVNYSDSEKCCW